MNEQTQVTVLTMPENEVCLARKKVDKYFANNEDLIVWVKSLYCEPFLSDFCSGN